MIASKGIEASTIIRVKIAQDGQDAIVEMRRILDIYAPLIPYYGDYWLDNPAVTSEEWLEMGGPQIAPSSWSAEAKDGRVAGSKFTQRPFRP